MKKFLAKITLFAITSLILISLSSVLTYAEEQPLADEPPSGDEMSATSTDNKTSDASATALELTKGLDDLIGKDCIKDVKADKKTPDDDYGYLVTIVEEPLTIEESKTKTKNGDDFESRLCYRNTLSYTIPGKAEKTVSILATDCSEKIKNDEFSDDKYKEYKVTSSCKPVQVYLSKGGTSLILNYISTIYKWAASIVGIVAVTVIIISGIQISLAGGDTQAVENAKARIIKSLSGIVILFLSGLILYTINPTFFIR